MERLARASPTRPGPWYATFSGLSAIFVGIGLARFSYTPLLPAHVEAGWFVPADAAYIGAASLAGYLLGALLAGRTAAIAGAPPALRAMMVLTALSLIACAYPLSFSWFFAWRLVAGWTGGTLMVLGPLTVLRAVPQSRRGLASGVIFSGVGIGIAASAALTPMLLRFGLAEAWWSLGGAVLVLAALTWSGWPGGPAAAPAAPPKAAHVPSRPRFALKALYVEYALNAVALVPHMVFYADYVARGLGRGVAAGAEQWLWVGFGAIAGPVAYGTLGGRIGYGPTLRLLLALQVAVIASPLVFTQPALLAVSSFVVGSLIPGTAPVVFGRVQDLAGGDGRRQVAFWGIATTAFAIGQVGGAHGFSYLFAKTGGAYHLLFTIASGAVLAALIVDLAVGAAGRAAKANPRGDLR